MKKCFIILFNILFPIINFYAVLHRDGMYWRVDYIEEKFINFHWIISRKTIEFKQKDVLILTPVDFSREKIDIKNKIIYLSPARFDVLRFL